MSNAKDLGYEWRSSPGLALRTRRMVLHFIHLVGERDRALSIAVNKQLPQPLLRVLYSAKVNGSTQAYDLLDTGNQVCFFH